MELIIEKDLSRASIAFYLKDRRGHADTLYSIKDGVLCENMVTSRE